MAEDAKITQDEMAEMFGDEIPMEAVELLWKSPDHMTVGQIRSKLRAMGTHHRVVEIMANAIHSVEGGPDEDIYHDRVAARAALKAVLAAGYVIARVTHRAAEPFVWDSDLDVAFEAARALHTGEEASEATTEPKTENGLPDAS